MPMRVLEGALALVIGSTLGALVLYLGYLMGQSRYGRGKPCTIQTLFSRIRSK